MTEGFVDRFMAQGRLKQRTIGDFDRAVYKEWHRATSGDIERARSVLHDKLRKTPEYEAEMRAMKAKLADETADSELRAHHWRPPR